MGVSPKNFLKNGAVEGQELDRQEFDRWELDRHDWAFRLRHPSKNEALEGKELGRQERHGAISQVRFA